MTQQETQLLQAFLDRLTQTQAVNKDSDAEQRIAQAIAKQPDAAYLLTQRSLLLEQALASAQSHITQLQFELQTFQANKPTPGASGFLNADNSWGRSAQAISPSPVATQSSQQNPYAQPASSGFFGGNTGSLLGTVAATAGGVAAGAFLYQGLGSLMGNHAPTTPASENNLTSSGNADHDANSASLNDGNGEGLISNYFEEDSNGADVSDIVSADDSI